MLKFKTSLLSTEPPISAASGKNFKTEVKRLREKYS
jgi:hypothetical protein